MFSIKKKLIVYGIPYVIFLTILWGEKFIFSKYTNNSLDIKDLLNIWLYPISFLWFLYALVIISIVHLIIEDLFKDVSGNKKYRLFVLIIAVALNLLANCLSQTVTCFNVKDLGVIDAARMYQWFVIGNYFLKTIADYFIFGLCEVKKAFKYYIVFAFILYGVIVYFIDRFYCYGYFLKALTVFSGCMLIVVLALYLNNVPIIELLGTLTMPIYLLHGFVLSATRLALIRFHIPTFGGLTPIIVCTILGTAIPIMLYKKFNTLKLFDFCFYPGRYLLNNGSSVMSNSNH